MKISLILTTVHATRIEKSTLRLPGLKARACLRRELSRTLRVDPERRFLTPPSKAGLGAVEWVNLSKDRITYEFKKA